ncbi:hypothetical protein [uncultured Campylobacter sp.]|uniref:hypothetical protein n=1 Tax=uncultured Campylobacter sp. TaxID=218934 RepID=UPI002624CC68|nr:hypothetical protein [uncultured Campylobacter sp.]
MQIIENNAKACVSMQRCDLRVAAFHNSREGFIPESSRPELAKKNKCSCSALAALQKIQKWDQKADEAYAKTHGGRKSPVKEANKCWEAVINLNSRHDMKDVKKLVKKLEKITGYRAAQIALHKDEGHINEDGDFVRNIHAHVIFYARDLKTGLSLSAANYARKDLMRQMQDAVADELGMERGQSAEITGKKHLSPRAFKAQKRQEAALEKNNAEWQEKLAQNNKEWEQKKAEWEAKQAEREAKREEWERKIPEVLAARERRSKYISEQLDWEHARTGKMLAREMQMLGVSFAGINNPQGNILVEAQKSAIRNIFYMLGVTAQLAVVLMKKTIANDEKLAADAKIYNVESTLLRAVDYIANSDKDNGEELKIRIQRTFLGIPEDKREELFLYALENAPTPELKADIQALIEGRFSDIAKSAAAQKRIENRDLRAELKAYSEEIRKIKEDLRAMEEENRILVAAERALLREKGAERSEYAEQEAENRKRIEELKTLKDEAKLINNDLRDQKQSPDKDAQTIREQAEKIEELTSKIAQISAENAKKQRELEEELEQEKAARERAEIITPQMLDAAFEKIDELEGRLKGREEQKPEPIREEPKIEPEPVKPEPEPEPEPIAKKADDFTNIYGYARPQPEPRRRLDEYERKTYDDRPKYEPIREPEPVKQPEKPRDEWQEIEDAIEKWRKTEDVGSKTLMTVDILGKLNAYEKSGWDISLEKQIRMNNFRRVANYDPVADELEAQKNAETIRKVAAIHRELDQKRQAEIQIETAIKYEDVKQKSVKQEADARQHNIKKKRKDELEFGSI